MTSWFAATENFVNGISLQAAGAVMFGQALFLLAAFYFSRRALDEHRRTTEEMRSMVRKTEAITADEREQVLKVYDQSMRRILKRLPEQLAHRTEDALCSTEELILKRLAELEPNLRSDTVARERLDDLIRSMERLNDSMILVNIEAVEQTLLESREVLRRDLTFSDLPSEAAG